MLRNQIFFYIFAPCFPARHILYIHKLCGSLYVSIGNFLYLCTRFYNILMYERKYSPAFNKLRECNAVAECQPGGKEAERKGKEAQRAGRAAGEVAPQDGKHIKEDYLGCSGGRYRCTR